MFISHDQNQCSTPPLAAVPPPLLHAVSIQKHTQPSRPVGLNSNSPRRRCWSVMLSWYHCEGHGRGGACCYFGGHCRLMIGLSPTRQDFIQSPGVICRCAEPVCLRCRASGPMTVRRWKVLSSPKTRTQHFFSFCAFFQAVCIKLPVILCLIPDL